MSVEYAPGYAPYPTIERALLPTLAYIALLLLIFVGLDAFSPPPAASPSGGLPSTASGDALRQIAFLGTAGLVAIGAFQRLGLGMLRALPVSIILLLVWCLNCAHGAAEFGLQLVIGKLERETRADGAVRWLSTTKMPMRNEQGRIVGTFGISRDVTDLKQMQEQLWQERNLLRSVIDNLPDHVFLKDTQGKYLLDNLAHQKWLGYEDLDHVHGKTVFDFFPEEIARKLDADDAAVLASGEPMVNHEEMLVTADGQTRWVVTSKVPWRGEGSETIGLVCITRDITSQKAAEENLRKVNFELRQSREKTLVAMQRLQ